MHMKYQRGFAPLIIILIVVIAAAVGGGYELYKKQHAVKGNVTVENTQNVSPAQPVAQTAVTQENTAAPAATASANTAAMVSCGNDANCLISAAAQCQSANGTISYVNMEHPLLKGLVISGKNTFSMKKSGSSCVLNQHSVIQGASLSATGRAELMANGSTSAEIDEEIRSINESMKENGTADFVCKGNNSTIGTFLTDLKNEYFSADTSFKAGFDSSESTITTSTGQKLVCTS
jgi:hypothetical protein